MADRTAQDVQALAAIAVVTQGLYTSMNQARIGAMAGMGLNRGRETVQCTQVVGVVRGWAIGPASGFLPAFVLESIQRRATR